MHRLVEGDDLLIKQLRSLSNQSFYKNAICKSVEAEYRDQSERGLKLERGEILPNTIHKKGVGIFLGDLILVPEASKL